MVSKKIRPDFKRVFLGQTTPEMAGEAAKSVKKIASTPAGIRALARGIWEQETCGQHRGVELTIGYLHVFEA